MKHDDPEEAKRFWASTEAQGKDYVKLPFYVQALRHVVQRLAPRSVLEMGCNAGRNLKMLRAAMPASTQLRGFDINAKSIEHGRAKCNLDLEVADEAYLARQPSSSVDILFTVSVLDHLPVIDATLGEIARIAKYYVSVEPWPEAEVRYLDVFKQDGRVRPTVTSDTPFSYLHPYDQLAPKVGLRSCLDVPMPPYAANFGPLYRLTVYDKVDSGSPPVPWAQLRDELMFAAVSAAQPA